MILSVGDVITARKNRVYVPYHIAENTDMSAPVVITEFLGDPRATRTPEEMHLLRKFPAIESTYVTRSDCNLPMFVGVWYSNIFVFILTTRDIETISWDNK